MTHSQQCELKLETFYKARFKIETFFVLKVGHVVKTCVQIGETRQTWFDISCVFETFLTRDPVFQNCTQI